MFKNLARKISHLHKVICQKTESGDAYYLQNTKTNKTESFWTTFPPTKTHYKTINCIIEVPRGTLAKFQVIKDLPDHPISQDKRTLNNQKVNRYYQMGTFFNYGFIPQTWDSNRTGKYQVPDFIGDNDPLDVIEISPGPIYSMLPQECVILGALGLIDQEEIDWKIITLERDYAKQMNINSLNDVLELFPDKMDYIREYYRMYKTHEGKPQNTFLNEGKYYDEEAALQIIKDAHAEFNDLLKNESLRELAKTYKLI